MIARVVWYTESKQFGKEWRNDTAECHSISEPPSRHNQTCLEGIEGAIANYWHSHIKVDMSYSSSV